MIVDKKIYEYVSRETVLKYELYLRELMQWNKALSLVQTSTIPEFWTRHILDSLQIMNLICVDSYVIDIGSGAGFPGLALAIAGITNITLCESNKKKCLFL